MERMTIKGTIRGLVRLLVLVGVYGLSTGVAAASPVGCFLNGAKYCGGPSPAGCFCDDACTSYGDCCADYEQVCKYIPPPPATTVGKLSCTTQEVPGTANANTFAVTNATCTAGQATGAGAMWWTPSGGSDHGPFYLYPREDGVTWTVVPHNHSGSRQDYRVFLRCCKVVP